MRFIDFTFSCFFPPAHLRTSSAETKSDSKTGFETGFEATAKRSNTDRPNSQSCMEGYHMCSASFWRVCRKTQQLTTWADTNLHLLLLKSSIGSSNIFLASKTISIYLGRNASGTNTWRWPICLRAQLLLWNKYQRGRGWPIFIKQHFNILRC